MMWWMDERELMFCVWVVVSGELRSGVEWDRGGGRGESVGWMDLRGFGFGGISLKLMKIVRLEMGLGWDFA